MYIAYLQEHGLIIIYENLSKVHGEKLYKVETPSINV